MSGRCTLTVKRSNDYFVSGSELADVMSHLKAEKTYFIAGTHSIYVPKGRVRYIDKSVCKPWLGLDGQYRLHSPGEAARTELIREWPDLKRVGWPGGAIKLLNWRSPMFYSGPHVGPMIYIDLVGAYSQIYEKLFLDTSFPRGYYGQWALGAVADRLKVWKSARNALIGIARSTEAVAYRGTARIRLKTKNRFLSPGLWATVQAILHWIADEAIKNGAIYANVDGYILPTVAWEFVENFLFFLSDHDILWSIRDQGPGEIVTWNNYRVGSTRTQAYKLNLTHKSRSFTNVTNCDGEKWATYWRNIGKIARANGVSTK